MPLILPFSGSITQYFGSPATSVVSREPAMWHVSNQRAWWLEFPGATYSPHFHPGVDLAAAEGTPILACEAGVVTFAGWKDDISGRQVEVRIGESAVYSFAHMAYIEVAAGQHVAKGQRLGTVGSTGSTTGPHTHWGVGLIVPPGNATWPTLYDPLSFLAGGVNAGSPLIRPPSLPDTSTAPAVVKEINLPTVTGLVESNRPIVINAGVNVRPLPSLSKAFSPPMITPKAEVATEHFTCTGDPAFGSRTWSAVWLYVNGGYRWCFVHRALTRPR